MNQAATAAHHRREGRERARAAFRPSTAVHWWSYGCAVFAAALELAHLL